MSLIKKHLLDVERRQQELYLLENLVKDIKIFNSLRPSDLIGKGYE